MKLPKLNSRQERFAQLIAGGSVSQTEAYRQAYGATKQTAAAIAVSASKLLRVAKVVARVEEIRAPMVEQAGLTFAGHLARLAELSSSAQKAGQHGPAIAAEVWRGKAVGYYAERVKTEDLDKLTEDELEMVSRGKVPARLRIVG